MSSTKALNAISPQIASSPYEPHQKTRTFASRYPKSGQYDTAIDVLFQSARELLKTGQASSGTDFAVFLLDVYEMKGETVNDDSRGAQCHGTRRDRWFEWHRQIDTTHRIDCLVGIMAEDHYWQIHSVRNGSLTARHCSYQWNTYYFWSGNGHSVNLISYGTL